ncbi:trypsin-like peptidase domain-containing protein [Candidatus Woesearchaeota archaeon]|nr:trypsin-like peptidase domain-containing protein [Candidatus Woesearchaeota archaeon]
MLKKLDSNRLLLIFLAVMVLVTGSIVLYYNSQLEKARQDYETKILTTNKNLLEALNAVKTGLDEDISAVQSNMSIQLAVVKSSLDSFRRQNEQEVNALNSLIEQIEEQSNIQLNQLKEEVSSIKVTGSDFSSIIDEVLESVVSVGTNKGQGSGAIIDSEGYIITNYHVVEGASTIRVLTYGQKVYDAQLIGYNDLVDIAVLKIDGNFKALRFGDSDSVKVGQKVIAAGNPAGLSFSVTEGIISAMHRPGQNNLNIYLQTDVPINPGNSGGPLIDANKRIVGINNFKIGGFEGLGFAIESNTAEDVSQQIIGEWEGQQQ